MQRPPPRSAPARVVGWVVTALVWATWAAMLALALWLVVSFGSPVPFRDDWSYVPVLTGERPYAVSWLLERFLDHRLFLTRILVIAQVSVAGGDFRASMFVNVLAMAALAAGMIVIARRVRGEQLLADAFFPLTLLGVTQFDPFLQAMPQGHILTTVCAGTLLLLIVRNRGLWSRRDTLLGGAAFLGLALGCASGLPYIPMLAVFLSLMVVLRANVVGRRDAVLLLFPLAAAAYVVSYFVGYQRPEFNVAEADLAMKLWTSVSFLGMGLGMGSQQWIPYVGAAVAALLALGGAALVWVTYARPAERLRALGMICYLGALAALALSIGWGRAAHINYGYVSHYVTVALPVVCCLYFLPALVHPRAGRLVQTALAGFAVYLWYFNILIGLPGAAEYKARNRPLEVALRARLAPEQIAEYIHEEPFAADPKGFASHLRMLRRAGVGGFAHLPDVSAVAEVAVAVERATVKDLNWEGRSGQVLGPEPSLLCYLPRRGHVYAVRVVIAYEGEFDEPAVLTVVTGRIEGHGLDGVNSVKLKLDPFDPKPLMVWLDAEIDFVVLNPDPRARELTLDAVTLLTPRKER